MTTQTKTKASGWRKTLKWISLPALIVFLALWQQYGIAISDTRELHCDLANTTRIEVRYELGEGIWPETKFFTLSGQEARDFVRSILIKRQDQFQIIGGKWSTCTFYQDKKLLTTLTFIDHGQRGLLLWDKRKDAGFITLHPLSRRHIYKIFEEHAGSKAK